jgi:hypothetical protein
MSRQGVVVLADRRRREAGVGWCWSANCAGYKFELMVPDDLLDRLKLQGISPFSGERAEARLFFERLEAGVGRRLARDARRPSFIILSSDDLADVR